jgi:PEP-CTERM motif
MRGIPDQNIGACPFQPSTTGPTVYLPTLVQTNRGTGFAYQFNVEVSTGQAINIDPLAAVGFIYQTGVGDPNFASVELPDIGNPNPYDLYLWNGSTFVFDTTLASNTVFDFPLGGVSEFEVLGIDPNLELDPSNSTDFVTTLTFSGSGTFTGTMTPVTEDVPEPRTLLLLGSGLAALVVMRRRQKMQRRAVWT